VTFAAAGRGRPEVSGRGEERSAGGGDRKAGRTSSAEGERGANDLDFDLCRAGAAGWQTWLSQEVADLAANPGAPPISGGIGQFQRRGRRRRRWAWRLLAIKEIFHTQL